MWENIRVYRVDNGKKFRVMGTYSTGGAFDFEVEHTSDSNTDVINIPKSDKGDPALEIVITRIGDFKNVPSDS